MSDATGAGRPIVALTGGTGFIGGALLPRLAAAGYRVRALYRPQPGRVVKNTLDVEWVPGTLDDLAALKTLVAGAKAVIHCAGAVRGKSRADFDRINEAGVFNITQIAEAQPGCQRLLLFSSLAAREPQLSHYAGSKQRGERMVAQVARRLEWTVFRPPAVYGPGDREMLALFRAMARGWAPVPGTGRGRFSLIYVSDLADAAVKWLVCGGGNGQTYELDDGTDGGYGWDSVLQIAARVLRRNKPIHRLPIPVGLFRCMAWINLAAAKAFGYPPMLTPGKVREITHANWVCRDGAAFVREMNWRPAYKFERGLVCTLAKHDVVSN